VPRKKLGALDTLGGLASVQAVGRTFVTSAPEPPAKSFLSQLPEVKRDATICRDFWFFGAPKLLDDDAAHNVKAQDRLRRCSNT
jgi:hypothetical protein